MPRQSNFELLRIVAMLFVLALHASYSAFSFPNIHSVQADPLSWLGIILTGQTVMCAVNTFVLITGWFGTRLKWENFFRLVFQVFFYCLLITVGVYLVRGERHSFGEFVASLSEYWFIGSYLLLYLLTPVLNTFIEQCDERSLRRYLVGFFAVTISLSLVLDDLNQGYSVFCFVGLYLLGRYLRLYGAARWAALPRRRFLQLFVANTLILSLGAWVYYCLVPTHFPNPSFLMIDYYSPFVLLNAVFLVLYFDRLRLQSKVINWLAAGSLAAYLTHQQVFVRNDYFQLIRTLDAQFSTPLFILTTAGALLLLFLLSASVDHLREWTWRQLLLLVKRGREK